MNQTQTDAEARPPVELLMREEESKDGGRLDISKPGMHPNALPVTTAVVGGWRIDWL